MNWFKPIADRVLVEPIVVDDKTLSGIYIPDTAKEKPLRGKVKAVGPGKEGYKMMLSPGDEILFTRNVGIEIKVQGKDYLIIKESEVLGTLSGTEKPREITLKA